MLKRWRIKEPISSEWNHSGNIIDVQKNHYTIEFKDDNPDNVKIPDDIQIIVNDSGTTSVDVDFTDHYLVQINTANEGSVGNNQHIIKKGERISFLINIDENYTIDNIDGVDGTVEGNVFTTDFIVEPTIINIGFTLVHHTVNASVSSGLGSVSIVSQQIEHGSIASITITPGENYEISSITGCGGSLIGNVYTTGSITEDCQISVEFTLVKYTVSASVISGFGAISLESQQIEHGSTASITITPNIDYGIDSVTGCGGSLIDNVYTTGPITDDCNISVSFILIHTVSASIITGFGTITPESQQIKHGSTANITITPNESYQIDSVTGCGGSLVDNTYTTGPITDDCNVSVEFILVHIVTATSDVNGSIVPSTRIVRHGDTTNFTFTANLGYEIDSIDGCGGSLVGNVYTTGPITGACHIHGTNKYDYNITRMLYFKINEEDHTEHVFDGNLPIVPSISLLTNVILEEPAILPKQELNLPIAPSTSLLTNVILEEPAILPKQELNLPIAPSTSIDTLLKYPVIYNGNGSNAESNITTGGTATASSTNSTDVVERAFDGSTSSYWRPSSSTNEWVEYDLGSGNENAVDKIRIYVGNTTYCPKDIIFQGYNTSNNDWDDLLSTTLNSIIGWQDFNIPNSVKYQRYRLFIVNSYSLWRIYLYELIMLTGVGPVDSEYYISNATATVLGPWSLAKTGYTFIGWNTEIDGTGTNYNIGDTFEILEATTLYAKWE